MSSNLLNVIKGLVIGSFLSVLFLLWTPSNEVTAEIKGNGISPLEVGTLVFIGDQEKEYCHRFKGSYPDGMTVNGAVCKNELWGDWKINIGGLK